MRGSYPHAPQAQMDTDELAVILYSGGTTGVPKGIMLSNMNFISEGMQVSEWGKLSDADSILAILPIFHGFGLGVCVNACFMGAARVSSCHNLRRKRLLNLSAPKNLPLSLVYRLFSMP